MNPTIFNDKNSIPSFSLLSEKIIMKTRKYKLVEYVHKNDISNQITSTFILLRKRLFQFDMKNPCCCTSNKLKAIQKFYKLAML